MNRIVKCLTGGLFLGALVACDDFIDNRPMPAERPAPPAKAEVAERSEKSLGLESYYADVQRNLLVQGLLRKGGGGIDTPFSKRQLVDSFVRIAAFNEFTLSAGRYVETPSEGKIQRWTVPVRVSMEFGPQVDPARAAQDRQFVNSYLSRLARVSGNRITPTRGNGNFHVAVLTVDEMDAFGPRLMELVPGLSADLARQITDLPKPVYCAVYAFTDETDPNSFDKAVAIIRAEHPDLLRQSCYHEEIAQGLGLSNDSPAARPSIFNDDDEFAYLTRHDELLLQMLYDARMPLGASPEEAREVANVIASELLGGES